MKLKEGRINADLHRGLTRRQILAAAAGALCAPVSRAAPAIGDAWRNLDLLCKKALADQLAPGFSLSVMHADQLLYSKGFGFANLETNTPVKPRSVFRIGSITKQFTATAILLLAEDGKLTVDDKLSRFLPDFPHADTITLKQMLTHTSGLGNYTQTDTPEMFIQAARTDYNDQALLTAMRNTNPLFASRPGTTWQYSNTAYVLLGLVIGKASGVPYSRFFQERLMTPIGLSSTAVDDAATVVPGRVSGYTPNSATPSGFDNASFISMSFPGAAGSIRSTTEDLCRWHQALLGGRVLMPQFLTAMLTPVRLNDGSLPMEDSSSATHQPPTQLQYGYGLALGTSAGRRWVDHHGSINGFISQLRTFPAQKISAAVLINSDLTSRPTLAVEMTGLRDEALRIALKSARGASLS
jgi:D-alanyl-D-alanine carboxypeptidase